MPYIENSERDQVVSKIQFIQTPGQLNFLLTRYLLQVWKSHPRYDTIHCFRRDFVVDPKNNSLLQDLRGNLAHLFTVADIYAASAEAYHEFRERVGKKYEQKKLGENGDLPEYVEALKDLEHSIPAEPVIEVAK
jgi:hypothetical protein